MLKREQRLKNRNSGRRRAMIALYSATLFTTVFMIVEILAGIYSGSLAIITDAAHLLTDIAAMGLSILSMHIANRGPSSRASFGWSRTEILGALASILLIWLLIGVVIYEAIQRLIRDISLDGEEVNGMIMTIVGGLGLLVNLIDAGILWLGNAPHSHSHGSGGHSHSGGGGHSHAKSKSKSHSHSQSPSSPDSGSINSDFHQEQQSLVKSDHGHDYGTKSKSKSGHGHSHGSKSKSGHGHSHGSKSKKKTTKKRDAGDEENLNVSAAFIHVLGDCIQSVGVIIAAGVLWAGNYFTFHVRNGAYARSYYNIADPAISLLFALITLLTTFRLVMQLLNVLLERVPDDIDMKQVKKELDSIPGVEQVHDLHIWSISHGKTYASVHVMSKNYTCFHGLSCLRASVAHLLSLKGLFTFISHNPFFKV
eukprot:TRINITY_DN168_c1_g1_i2.p1 TRINITY_DN168_c1_g1~~TRINITY_DN168_c1_g1_i2.p1  ORF type:complete len:478 (-),score=73.83 TRINITY_DN168_c1_g1_i2:38-1306(-)